MLRYLKKLEDRDLAMNRSMISLGSCTMKLNATAEMLPITWAEFTDIHPYAPKDQAAGYRALLTDMENSLKAITGFDAIPSSPTPARRANTAACCPSVAIKKPTARDTATSA